MNVFLCSVPECGRRFREKGDLESHMKRRHPKMNNSPDRSLLTTMDNSSEDIDNALNMNKEELLVEENRLQKELAQFDEKETNQTISTKDVMASREKLTTEFILGKAICDSMEDIQSLYLREEELYLFEDTKNFKVDDLRNLECLSLSTNKLYNVLGLRSLINLIEVNINFNQVRDISPLNECLNLEKIFASNNFITSISGLKDLTNLKVLDVFKNKIKDFDQSIDTLKSFPRLEELGIGHNPCTRKFSYKYDILFHIKLKKLDDEKIQEIDYELSRSFANKASSAEQWEQEEEETTEQEEPKSGLQRPSTAPGRTRKHNFADKMKQRVKEYSKPQVLPGIPEHVNSERVEELEIENEALRTQKTDAETELELLKGKYENLEREVEQLKNESKILKIEAQNAYILMDQNQELKKEIDQLKESKQDGQISSESTEMLRQENRLLHEKLADIVKDNQDLKKMVERQARVRARSKLRESESEDTTRKREPSNDSVASNSSFTSDRPGGSKSFRIVKANSSGLTPKKRPVQFFPPQQQNSINANQNMNSMEVIGRSGRIVQGPPSRGSSQERLLQKLPQAQNRTMLPKVGNKTGGGFDIKAKKVTVGGGGVKVMKPVREKQEEHYPQDEEEGLDKEIEDLLMRNSLQLSQLRSELRNFDFIESARPSSSKEKRMDVIDNQDDDDDDDDDDDHISFNSDDQ